MNTDLLIATFNENIAYIESAHEKLYQKLVELDTAVVNGHYKEKYELVFDNGYFEVVEKATNNCLYIKNSDEYAKLSAQSIDYKLDNNLFICSPQNHNLDKHPILEYIQDKLDSKNTLDRLKEINKFIFFGVGLGLHLKTINEQINATSYLIVEDDLELFRLSLFTMNYKSLAENAKLFFSVFDNTTEFSMASDAFLSFQYENNKYIKYFEMLNQAKTKREAFHVSAVTQPHLNFDSSAMLTQSLLPLEYLFDSYQFLDKGVSFENTELEHKPFLLLGAGPSLQKNINVLKDKADNFIVVAVSATLRLLEKENIVPDIVVHLDAFEAARKHFGSLNSLDFIKDSICLFSAKIDPLITLRLNQKNIFFFENGTSYKTNSFRPSSSCVGSIAYQILVYLKIKNIYLLGLDLAIDSKTGKTHSDEHIYGVTVDLNNKTSNAELVGYKTHLLSVEGNKEKEVLTMPNFKASIDTINYSTRVFKEDSQTIINFSDGAKFTDVHYANFEDYSDKEKLINKKEKLKKVFLKDISNTLTDNEMKSLKNKLVHAKQVRKKLQRYTNNKVKTTKEFKSNFLRLKNDIAQDLTQDLCKILDIYFKQVTPHIFDFLNREEIEVTEEDFNALNTMLVMYLLKII